MKLSRFFILPAAALLLAGCAIDDAPTENSRPAGLSGVRFIHAIADEGAVDARMYDQTEWSSYALGINFRQSGAIHPTEPGTRPIRVFRASTDIDAIDDILIEQTVDIPAGQPLVTLLLTGSVQSGTAQIQVITGSVPDSTAGSVHYRVFNATGTPYVARYEDVGGEGGSFTVNQFSGSEYQTRAVGTAYMVTAFWDPGDPGTIFGGGHPTEDIWNPNFPWSIPWANNRSAMPLRAPEANGIGATAGSRASGSAMSAFIFPASVAGTRAPRDPVPVPPDPEEEDADLWIPPPPFYNTPNIVWFIDRVPAPPRF